MKTKKSGLIKPLIFSILITFIFFLSACASNSTPPVNNQAESPTLPAEPEDQPDDAGVQENSSGDDQAGQQPDSPEVELPTVDISEPLAGRDCDADELNTYLNYVQQEDERIQKELEQLRQDDFTEEELIELATEFLNTADQKIKELDDVPYAYCAKKLHAYLSLTYEQYRLLLLAGVNGDDTNFATIKQTLSETMGSFRKEFNKYYPEP